MPERPAPHHSAALNQMLGLPPVHPELEPPLPPVPADQLAAQRHRDQLRRKAAARSRSRRTAA